MFSFSTVDHTQLKWRRIRNERGARLLCCSKIQIVITNSEHSSAIALELFAVNNSVPGQPSQALGRVMVAAAAEETLDFKVPPAPPVTRFDEFKVIFHRVRSDHSARISTPSVSCSYRAGCRIEIHIR